MLKIHDIKPLSTIPDHSIYLYYSAVSAVIIILLLSIYFIYKFFKSRSNNLDKTYYEILKNIDFSDTKKSAYTISKYGRLLAKTQREQTLINDIHSMLQQYKYKKKISQEIDNNVKVKFHTFLESLDVK